MDRFRKPLKRVAAVGAALAAVMTLTVTPAYADGSWHGCPVGAACLFTGDNTDNPGGIIYTWWDGVYTLQDIYGDHVIVNNQTDRWQIDLCTDWNGSICTYRLTSYPPYNYKKIDFTPINSVRLHPNENP